ncbi:uncharacterized protein LOC118732716 [Rhagoletis pomonella]|uniref:uncharacterized protein LOC118732716 n=1 Tax=Rhagoletis pomonella TaxID=28610 RepID=UPI00177D88CF|nr:uncharacterized protein LOC118732716 [Rhagoletis pomonella]
MKLDELKYAKDQDVTVRDVTIDCHNKPDDVPAVVDVPVAADVPAATDIPTAVDVAAAADVPEIFCIDVPHGGNDIDLGTRLTGNQRNDLERLIVNTYLKPEVTPEPFKYEMKIHLTTGVPFHCAPRRLSYAERNQVQTLAIHLMRQP